MPAKPSGLPQSDGRTCETCQQPVTRHVSDCAGVRNVRAHAVAAARPVAVWEALGSARGPAAVQFVIDGLEGCDHAPLVSKLRDLQALAGLDPLAPVADPEPWKNSLRMLATTPTAGGRSALTVVVEAVGLARPVEPDRRSDGIFPASLAAVRTVAPDPDTSRVPVALDAPALLGCAPGGSSWLPGVDGTSETGIVRPALPLLLFDGAGLVSMTRGRGAPLALRLFVEAVLTVPRDQRSGVTRIVLTLRDWRDWLWANGGVSLAKAWPRFTRALLLVHNARIPWAGGLWSAVRVVNVPRGAVCLDDHVVFDVELPPGSDRGPWVNRPRLRLWGMHSAPAYRAMLGLATLWNTYGTTRVTTRGQRRTTHIQATRPTVRRDADGQVLDTRGQVLTGRGGHPVRSNWDRRAVRTGTRERNPAADRYPVLSDDDLIRLCYAAVLRDAHKRGAQRTRSRAVLETLAAEGDVVIEQNADGWRVLPGPRWDNRLNLRGQPVESEWTTG